VSADNAGPRWSAWRRSPLRTRARALARRAGGPIARSAKGASHAPSASRRSIPSHCGGRKKGHRWTRHPNATGGEALAELESKSSGRFLCERQTHFPSPAYSARHPLPVNGERGRNVRGRDKKAYNGVSASRFERMVASSRSSSRSRRRRDSSVIFPSRSNS
jgi:hypothetical protein